MAKKQTIRTTEKPRLIETTYEYNGIKIGVRIDFRQRRITLTDTDGQGTKKWVFAKRELEYMDGWRNILTAMRYAIDSAEKVLREYVEQEEVEKLELAKAVMEAK